MNELHNIKEFIGFPEQVVINHFCSNHNWESVSCFNDYRSILVNKEKGKSIKMFVEFTEAGVMEVYDIEVLDYVWEEDSTFSKVLEGSKSAPSAEDIRNEIYSMFPIEGELRARSFTEDFKYENGNYQSTCKFCTKEFMGHKNRFVCKKCANDSSVENTEPKMNWKSLAIFILIIAVYFIIFIYMATRQ